MLAARQSSVVTGMGNRRLASWDGWAWLAGSRFGQSATTKPIQKSRSDNRSGDPHAVPIRLQPPRGQTLNKGPTSETDCPSARLMGPPNTNTLSACGHKKKIAKTAQCRLDRGAKQAEGPKQPETGDRAMFPVLSILRAAST